MYECLIIKQIYKNTILKYKKRHQNKDKRLIDKVAKSNGFL